MNKNITKPVVKPIAVIYRGPASDDNSCDAIRLAIKNKFDIIFAGPKETIDVPKALSTKPLPLIYFQPGGGDDLDVAWESVKSYKEPIREYISNGGHYIGICMGGFLAGQDLLENDSKSGYCLLQESETDSLDYKELRDSDVKNMDDCLIKIKWRGIDKKVYFQGGPAFELDDEYKTSKNINVLARYTNNYIAAMVVPFGKGFVGVCGPHPEASIDWYSIFPGSQPVVELFIDLINTTCSLN